MAENIECHTFVDYLYRTVIPGWIVPQRVYRTDIAGFQPRPPVQFHVYGQFGIRLTDALAQNFAGLTDSSRQVVLTETGMKIAVRIWWPGYERWLKHTHAYGHSSERPPITLSQLAYRVSRLVQEFQEEMRGKASTERSPDWWISNVPFHQLVLLELRHVSTGSWQPVLCRAVN
ncbi:hypothetical protein BDW22DRAFT_1361993 [Trametopsis cervina]|nr:hypothetical protein BDW22DRAFT_1361993 [Trametopsis cervina]